MREPICPHVDFVKSEPASFLDIQTPPTDLVRRRRKFWGFGTWILRFALKNQRFLTAKSSQNDAKN